LKFVDVIVGSSKKYQVGKVKAIGSSLVTAGTKQRGHPRQTWQDCVSHDLKRSRLSREDAFKWNKWKSIV